MNGEPFDEFESRFARPICRSVLADGWQVSGKDSLEATLQWLAVQGHNRQAQRLARGEQPSGALECEYPDQRRAFVESRREEVLDHGLAGWDLGRGISVVRWAATAGYMTRINAWSWACTAASRIQSTHRSWEQYALVWELGTGFWSDGAGFADLETAAHWLRTNARSPWRTLPWDTDLSAADLMGPP